jgi:hypothetical protein
MLHHNTPRDAARCIAELADKVYKAEQVQNAAATRGAAALGKHS